MKMNVQGKPYFTVRKLSGVDPRGKNIRKEKEKRESK